jgi:hypothetical protein
MQIARPATWRLLAERRMLLPLLLCTFFTGCAALTNPVANGIPVHLLAPELLGEPKDDLLPIPLTSLRQPRPEYYKLGPEDVLGVWVEGVLGEKGQAPPISVRSTTEATKLPPSLGFPIPVRGDGTISLPLIPPVKVQGMSLEQAEAAIRKSYVEDNKILQPGRERIIVTLQQPRQYHILVIRQDGGLDSASTGLGTGAAGQGITGQTTGFVLGVGGGPSSVRHGRGFAIDLPAYENDVLNALARTGGFPGSDSVNEIIIERGANREGQWRAEGSKTEEPGREDGQIIRIPLRIPRGQELTLTPDMITLQTGDVVYIEARTGDVYYTGGLLPPAAHLLPRDYDLDVVEAILKVGGILDSGGINALNINGTTTLTGLGNPSPSLVTVLRRTPNGGQVVIRVNLNRALRDRRERILVQPKDIIILQEQPQEAIVRYVTQQLHLDFVWQFFKTSNASGTGLLNVP